MTRSARTLSNLSRAAFGAAAGISRAVPGMSPATTAERAERRRRG